MKKFIKQIQNEIFKNNSSSSSSSNSSSSSEDESEAIEDVLLGRKFHSNLLICTISSHQFNHHQTNLLKQTQKNQSSSNLINQNENLQIQKNSMEIDEIEKSQFDQKFEKFIQDILQQPQLSTTISCSNSNYSSYPSPSTSSSSSFSSTSTINSPHSISFQSNHHPTNHHPNPSNLHHQSKNLNQFNQKLVTISNQNLSVIPEKPINQSNQSNSNPALSLRIKSCTESINLNNSNQINSSITQNENQPQNQNQIINNKKFSKLDPISTNHSHSSFKLKDRLASPPSASLASASSNGFNLIESNHHQSIPLSAPLISSNHQNHSNDRSFKKNLNHSNHRHRHIISNYHSSFQRSSLDRRHHPLSPISNHRRRFHSPPLLRSPPGPSRRYRYHYSPPHHSSNHFNHSIRRRSISPRSTSQRHRSSRTPPPPLPPHFDPRRKSPSHKRFNKRFSPPSYPHPNKRNHSQPLPHHSSTNSTSRTPLPPQNFHPTHQSNNSSTSQISSQKNSKTSILISNLPPYNVQTPKQLYQHLTQSVNFLESDDSPFELILYKFAGTARICVELKFHSETWARQFIKSALRRWPSEWYTSTDKSSSNQNLKESMEFTLVDGDRTQWPIHREIYIPESNPSTKLDLPKTSQDLINHNSIEIRPSSNQSIQKDQPEKLHAIQPLVSDHLNLSSIPSQSPSNHCDIVKLTCSINSPSCHTLQQSTSSDLILSEVKSNGVLLSDMKPLISLMVLQGYFIVPTRPRDFRTFEPIKIIYGLFTLEDQKNSLECSPGKIGCLILFEDVQTAKSFSKVLQEKPPFQPIQIKLVDPQKIHFSSSASVIEGQSDHSRTISPAPCPSSNSSLCEGLLATNSLPFNSLNFFNQSSLALEATRVIQMAEQSHLTNENDGSDMSRYVPPFNRPYQINLIATGQQQQQQQQQCHALSGPFQQSFGLSESLQKTLSLPGPFQQQFDLATSLQQQNPSLASFHHQHGLPDPVHQPSPLPTPFLTQSTLPHLPHHLPNAFQPLSTGSGSSPYVLPISSAPYHNNTLSSQAFNPIVLPPIHLNGNYHPPNPFETPDMKVSTCSVSDANKKKLDPSREEQLRQALLARRARF